ncbi:MAG: quinol:electron acceptor oxidoreductase subunit ActD, partial [Acidobacteriota bacterium]
MAEKVFALFETVTDARRAMRMLMDAEIGFEEVTICSTEPILDREFLPPENRKTRLPLFAMAGGVLGAAAGYLLPSLTARMMNLPTGGQPIVSLWAFGVVIFELTALGAIGGTVIALL